MRVEIEAQKVDETFETIRKIFRKQANLPGFRPGKAPREMVVRKYGKDIQDEVNASSFLIPTGRPWKTRSWTCWAIPTSKRYNLTRSIAAVRRHGRDGARIRIAGL